MSYIKVLIIFPPSGACMKFDINKKMLNFILSEWGNKDSKIFKGLNNYQVILENDSKEIIKIKIKIAHNSKYHLYSYILNLACKYKDVEFYLPVFSDFRGRFYPLSNYLNSQGGDLARSLIKFFAFRRQRRRIKRSKDLMFKCLFSRSSWL
jgi:hypothetical protein